ncbi:MAG: cyclophilin-like fold protein [Armatimonadota bacterium]|jgi:hypothetical protein
MARRIKITSGDATAEATLHDTPTADAIWDALPIQGSGSTWGDEIYFGIPVDVEREADARADVEVGELGFWLDGKCFCIFYGPTPASSGDQPRAASPVNVFGKIDTDASVFKGSGYGVSVTVEKLEE